MNEKYERHRDNFRNRNLYSCLGFSSEEPSVLLALLKDYGHGALPKANVKIEIYKGKPDPSETKLVTVNDLEKIVKEESLNNLDK